MIHTSLWEDENIAKLSTEARLLFIAMFSLADDEGRIKANPRYLKSAVFMYDDAVTIQSVISMKNEIASALKSLAFYTVEGNQYAQFINWETHQQIRSDRKKKSTIPQFDEALRDDGQMVAEMPQTRGESAANTKTFVRVIEEKGIEKNRKEKNIPIATARVTSSEVQRIVSFLDQTTGAKTTNFGKQAKAWKSMHDAGYTEKNILIAIEDMAKEEWWKAHGFDLTNVANNIAKVKQKLMNGGK